MFELKITGKDPQELYVNAVNLTVLLARGGHSIWPQQPASPAPVAETAPAQSEPVGDVTKIDPPIAEPVVEKKERKKREPKVEPPADDPLNLGPDVSETPAEPPTHTLDDMRQRVKDIVAKHTERGNEMPACVAYVRKLFLPFGIKLAAELKPEQFDEFWSASEKYLDGSAK